MISWARSANTIEVVVVRELWFALRLPPAKKREPIVPQKIRDAFEYILATPGAALQSTAAHVGMNTRMLRHKMQQSP